MLTIESIKSNDFKGGEYIAHCSDGKDYDASYNANLKIMFFCIPSHIEILGYSKK